MGERERDDDLEWGVKVQKMQKEQDHRTGWRALWRPLAIGRVAFRRHRPDTMELFFAVSLPITWNTPNCRMRNCPGQRSFTRYFWESLG